MQLKTTKNVQINHQDKGPLIAPQAIKALPIAIRVQCVRQHESDSDLSVFTGVGSCPSCSQG